MPISDKQLRILTERLYTFIQCFRLRFHAKLNLIGFNNCEVTEFLARPLSNFCALKNIFTEIIPLRQTISTNNGLPFHHEMLHIYLLLSLTFCYYVHGISLSLTIEKLQTSSHDHVTIFALSNIFVEKPTSS